MNSCQGRHYALIRDCVINKLQKHTYLTEIMILLLETVLATIQNVNCILLKLSSAMPQHCVNNLIDFFYSQYTMFYSLVICQLLAGPCECVEFLCVK